MTRPADEADRDDLKARVLSGLEKRRDARRTGDRPRTVSALVLARAYGIRPHARTEDSRKRGVRTIINALRAAGEPICSNDRGYWIATEPSDWAEYNAWRQRQGLAHLAAASRSKRSPQAAEATGQMSMFDTAGQSDNLAMVH
jgi:hypothetical protein